MVVKKNLLLRCFFASLLIYITGLSLFSLVLPAPKPESKPIEVSLLPASAAPEKIELAGSVPTYEIPKVTLGNEKIALVREQKPIRMSTEEFAGSPQYVPITKVSYKLSVPEFEVKLPDIISFTSLEKGIDQTSGNGDIEGPAGTRKLIYREQPDYPEWAKEKGIEGNVRIKFWVDPDGKVVLTDLLTSSGSPELDVYAEQVLRKYLFEPVNTDKEAWGIITFRFRLK